MDPSYIHLKNCLSILSWKSNCFGKLFFALPPNHLNYTEHILFFHLKLFKWMQEVSLSCLLKIKLPRNSCCFMLLSNHLYPNGTEYCPFFLHNQCLLSEYKKIYLPIQLPQLCFSCCFLNRCCDVLHPNHLHHTGWILFHLKPFKWKQEVIYTWKK